MYVYIFVGGVLATMILPAAFRVGWQHFLPKIRGAEGEKLVDRCLRKFRGKEFARAHDVMIRSGEKTSQIDNVLVSRYGIFVIETKNYAGIIEGRERTPNWVQILPKSKKKPREFFNPIWQNEGHIRALRGLFGAAYRKVPYYSVVAFSNNCRPPKIDGVVTIRELQKTIKSKMQGAPVLSVEEVAAIKGIIEKNNIKEPEARAEHLNNVRSAVSRSKERERQAVIRENMVKNMPAALAAQAAYSQAKADLEDENAVCGEVLNDSRDLNSLIKKADALHSVYAPVIKKDMGIER